MKDTALAALPQSYDPASTPVLPNSSAQQGPQPVRFSTLTGALDKHPVNQAVPWSQLLDALSQYAYRSDKLAGPLFSPATFTTEAATGQTRKLKGHVEAVHFLALDFDDATPEQTMAVLRKLEPFAALTYTTWKQPEATAKGLMRFRAVIPMSRSCSAAEWPTVYACAVRDFGASVADTACSDANRFYFTPALPFDAQGNPTTWAAQVWRSQGTGVWDVDAALRTPAAPLLGVGPDGQGGTGEHHAPVPIAAIKRAQVVKFARGLAGSTRPETASVGMCMVAALDGGPMGLANRHDAMLSITTYLAREFEAYTPESIAAAFADSFAAMDQQGVQEPSRDHFLGLMRSALRKHAQERATRARSGLLYTDKGVLKPNYANVLTLMSGADWDGVLAFNEFTNEIAKLREPPCRTTDRAQKASPCFDEADAVRSAAWFQSSHRLDVSDDIVMKAACTAARRKSFHPVREWLEGLAWDGAARHHMLPACFGADDTPYHRAALSRFLISAVARVFDPGCKVDTVLCLVGDQGKRKSTALAALTGPAEWFSDSQIDLDNKDGMQALRGKWIIEIPELDSFKGKSATRIKAFASSRIDNYRPSYGRQTGAFPRHCVFAATTNEPEFLTDQTGNRRFWPVKCKGTLDLDWLRSARDQLWAEAVALYRQGVPWWLEEADLEASAVEAQAEHTEQDPWLVHIARWIATGAPLTFSAADALTHAIELKPAQQDRRALTRAGMLLSKLGWGPRQLRGEGGKRTRRYELIDSDKWEAARAELGLLSLVKVRVDPSAWQQPSTHEASSDEARATA